MFRCSKCREVFGPGVMPHTVPTGFRTEKPGERVGEVLLCSRCNILYKNNKREIIQDKNCFHYRFLR